MSNSLSQVLKVLDFPTVALYKDTVKCSALAYDPVSSSLEDTIKGQLGDCNAAYIEFKDSFLDRLLLFRIITDDHSFLESPLVLLKLRSTLTPHNIHAFGIVAVLNRLYVLVDAGEHLTTKKIEQYTNDLSARLSSITGLSVEPYLKMIPLYVKETYANLFGFESGKSKKNSIKLFIKNDTKALIKEKLREALENIPLADKQEIKATLIEEDLRDAANNSNPMTVQLESDSLYTQEILKLRNYMILKDYAKPSRRYGMATAAILAAARAIAGKHLICKTKETGTVYCGTGVVLLGGTSGSGKSQCLDAAAKLYDIVTNTRAYVASKPTMAALIKAIQTMRCGGDKDKCLSDPRGFFWCADEFSASFKYLLADWSNSGSRDEGRFNTLFDSGSSTANDSLKSPINVWDNCNLMLAGIQPYLYATEFNPFDDARVASGFIGRLSVTFECEEFKTWDTSDTYDDYTNWDSLLDRLEKLHKTNGYYHCKTTSDTLIDRFVKYCGDLYATDAELVNSAAPKRVREALSEASLMTYMQHPKIKAADPFDSSLSKWNALLSSPHTVLECCGSFDINEQILDNRLKSQAYQFVNHYLAVSKFKSEASYDITIKRLLAGAKDGMRKDTIIRHVDSSARQYKDVSSTITAMISQGELFIVKRNIGAKGRPQERIILPKFVTHSDADNV